MNWYKIAQKKEKEGLSPQDFIDFYALVGLSDESFLSNVNLIYVYAEKLNYMRDYYLHHLFKQLVKEIQHLRDALLEEQILSEYIYNNHRYDELVYSKDEISFEEYKDKYRHNDSGTSISDSALHAQWTDYTFNSLTFELEDFVLDELEQWKSMLRAEDNRWHDIKSDYSQFSNDDLDKMIYYFSEMPWQAAFGGEAWTQIAQWTKRLYNTPPIDIENITNYQQVLRDIRYMEMIIDQIHSLEHNRECVLNNLPYNEGPWLRPMFELAKHAKYPEGFMHLTDDPEIYQAYRNEITFQQDVSHVPDNAWEFLENTFNGMDVDESNRAKYFLQSIASPNAIEGIMTSKEHRPLLLRNQYLSLAQFKRLVNSILEEEGVNKLADYLTLHDIRHYHSYNAYVSADKEFLQKRLHYLLMLDIPEIDAYLMNSRTGISLSQEDKLVFAKRYKEALLNPNSWNWDTVRKIASIIGYFNFENSKEYYKAYQPELYEIFLAAHERIVAYKNAYGLK